MLRSILLLPQGWAKSAQGSRRKKNRFACIDALAPEEKFSGGMRKKSHGTKVGANRLWR
jgi:hypothetical protein